MYDDQLGHTPKHDAPACGLPLHPVPTQPYSKLSSILLTLHLCLNYELFLLFICCKSKQSFSSWNGFS